MLMRSYHGERQVWRIVHVPSVAAEDQRHLHRDLETLKQERASTMKRTLLTSTIATFSVFGVMAQVPNKQSNQNPSDMNRIERAKKKSQELFGAQSVTNTSDPELMSILQGLIFGEIFYVGNLDDKTRELITITVLTTNQTLPQLKDHTNAALNIGVSPIQIREAVYQSAPFIGFPKVLNALDTINKVFTSRGIALPLENKGTVEENERFEKGREMQFPLYGDRMKESMKDLPAEFAEAIPRILTESCFGDFYTRGGLDTKTRELLIFCALATLGGTERQMASHAVGNLKVGNSKETLLSAMVHSYPYIGFPRVANAISVIKEAKVE
jgi:4-carboxymuconolactone decarboxylase